MEHPYKTLPDEAFWRRSVAGRGMEHVDPVGTAKFQIAKSDKVATAGSCFAQHIARHLARNGFTYLITETAHPGIWPHLAEAYNYGVFTARYGNLYTSRQFLQLLKRAYGLFEPVDSAWPAEDGRFIDPYRPQIQPKGFISEQELLADRAQHFAAIRKAVESLDVMVFTLGLTECWLNRTDGAAYPVCPGVSGGTFSPDSHVFHNLSVHEVIEDMTSALDFIRAKNPRAKFILTVSPVPLVATASGKTVLQATTYSKSVLRVAAEEIDAKYDYVAYFPSYEIITGAFNRGAYYGGDLRAVTEDGVSHVMRLFLHHYGAAQSDQAQPTNDAPFNRPEPSAAEIVAVICEEEVLGK